ncbi:MAG: RNA-dependent DNA polymerase, partial [Planctomycetota bacterium]
MKRHGNLFHQIVAWKNLWKAAQKARRGKWQRWNVAEFEFDREWNLLQLQSELSEGTYYPGDYRSFEIFEPKRRWISAAPYRDRIVHHAICHVIEPI